MKWINTRLTSNPHQRTADWYSCRLGKLTGSSMAHALNFRKDGKPGSYRVNLMKRLLAERMTDQVINQYVSPEMQWGIDNEEKARVAYENGMGSAVTLCGFIDHPSIDYCGVSPDGLVNGDGLIEIKCPSSETHIQYILSDGIPEEYKPQMLLQMACTGRKWCHFVSFDPRIKIVGKQVLIRRFEPSDQEILDIELAAAAFLAEVDLMFEKVIHE